MQSTTNIRRLLSLFLVMTLLGTLLVPAVNAKTGEIERTGKQEEAPIRLVETASALEEATRRVNAEIVIDDNAEGGYEGDYVVIYNPSTSETTSYSTGTMTGLIQTTINASVNADFNANLVGTDAAEIDNDRPYIIDVDAKMLELAETEADTPVEEAPGRATYTVGSIKTFTIYKQYSPNGTNSLEFKCLHVGQHCYIWTPTSAEDDTYPLDEIDESYAEMAADEFDAKYDLMQSSFGKHTNGSNGDGKLHILYYNVDDGWTPGRGYVGGFFYPTDISKNGLPILNIDTYPAVLYKNSNGVETKSIDGTYNTTVHEYQHLINYSNTSGMHTWLNESFSAAAEEICYPGSSVIPRIQSWENYAYSGSKWLNPPKEFKYTSSYSLHKGYSMYSWDGDLSDSLALYAQVSLFAQYLYSRFGNGIYKQISAQFKPSYSEVTAITNATGINCADLVRDFRVALTANAAEGQHDGRYGFKAQKDYKPSDYHNVQNPYSLLAPIIFTGSSCSIKGGGAITVKPVDGVYNPPAGANANLKYIGIKLPDDQTSAYKVSATSNNTSYGTVSVNGNVITASPKSGYYAASYTVTSGTATVSQNGNTFTVTPSSDCTVRINFAAKSKITITCIANGATYTTLTPYAGDTFNLPSAATNVNGYSFVGWSSKTVAETATKPSYFAPGAAVSGSANTTLYAVYTRTVSSGESTSGTFELLSAAPSNWAGNYAISYGTNTSSLYLLKGLAGDAKYETAAANGAVLLANSGASYADAKLNGVSAPYIFRIAANGSKYTIQNTATGAYVGSYNSYLYSRAAYNATYCLWSLSCNSGNITASNTAAKSYNYFSFGEGRNYFMLGTAAPKGLFFWKQSDNSTGTTYYTTSPAGAASTTKYTVSFSVPNGVSAVASQTVAAGSAITLPVAGAPSGYTFVGWVSSAVNSTTARPSNVLTGSYTVNGNITLRALYTYTTGTVSYKLLGSAPTTSWDGNYVITFGTNTNSLYALKGLSGDTKYESARNGSAVLLANTGMSYNNGNLTGVSAPYVFTVSADGSYYTIRNASTGTYLANYNFYLYSRTAYRADICRWTLSCNNKNMTVKNAANNSYPYLSFFSNSNYFMLKNTTSESLYFWKETASGSTYYTTG